MDPTSRSTEIYAATHTSLQHLLRRDRRVRPLEGGSTRTYRGNRACRRLRTQSLVSQTVRRSVFGCRMARVRDRHGRIPRFVYPVIADDTILANLDGGRAGMRGLVSSDRISRGCHSDGLRQFRCCLELCPTDHSDCGHDTSSHTSGSRSDRPGVVLAQRWNPRSVGVVR